MTPAFSPIQLYGGPPVSAAGSGAAFGMSVQATIEAERMKQAAMSALVQSVGRMASDARAYSARSKLMKQEHEYSVQQQAQQQQARQMQEENIARQKMTLEEWWSTHLADKDKSPVFSGAYKRTAAEVLMGDTGMTKAGFEAMVLSGKPQFDTPEKRDAYMKTFDKKVQQGYLNNDFLIESAKNFIEQENFYPSVVGPWFEEKLKGLPRTALEAEAKLYDEVVNDYLRPAHGPISVTAGIQQTGQLPGAMKDVAADVPTEFPYSSAIYQETTNPALAGMSPERSNVDINLLDTHMRLTQGKYPTAKVRPDGTLDLIPDPSVPQGLQDAINAMESYAGNPYATEGARGLAGGQGAKITVPAARKAAQAAPPLQQPGPVAPAGPPPTAASELDRIFGAGGKFFEED